jgi:polysaccharide export outer membrane protein
MIALSEGLSPYYTKEAYIYRQEGAGNKNEIPVPLEKIMQRKAPDVPLVANDILYIPDNKGKRVTLGTLEKMVGIGGALGAAALYVWH